MSSLAASHHPCQIGVPVPTLARTHVALFMCQINHTHTINNYCSYRSHDSLSHFAAVNVLAERVSRSIDPIPRSIQNICCGHACKQNATLNDSKKFKLAINSTEKITFIQAKYLTTNTRSRAIVCAIFEAWRPPASRSTLLHCKSINFECLMTS